MTTLANATKEITVLTDSEIELITEARLKAAKIQEEKEAKFQKEIQDKESIISKNIASAQLQVEAAKNFFYDDGIFNPKGWTINITPVIRVEKIGKYDDAGKYQILWEREYSTPIASIVSPDGKYKVRVVQHIVYNISWSSRGTNKGWTMQLDGPGIDSTYSRKYLKSVTTVLNKVEEVKQEAAYKLAQETKAKTRDEVVLEQLTAQFPTAKIDKSTDANYSRDRRTDFRSWVVYNVTLANGIQFKATPNSIGDEVSYSVSNVHEPKVEGPEFAAKLNSLS